VPGDLLSGTFWGTLSHQFTERIDYYDDENGLVAWYEPGTKGVQDYIVGAIEQHGVPI
jgi:hypothetical protein